MANSKADKPTLYPPVFYRASVKALVRDADNRVLVIKENQDEWSLPGGGLEHGEEPLAALRRELQEELGINEVFINPKPFTVRSFYLDVRKAWALWLVYAVDLSDDPVFAYGEGVTAAEFINPELLKEDLLFENTVREIALLENLKNNVDGMRAEYVASALAEPSFTQSSWV